MINFEKESKKTKPVIKVFLAVSYGGRAEIVSAIKKIPQKYIEKLTEKKFEEFLWSGGITEPEIVIRTGGAKRFSNFLL
jgi:undecaprenyl diphosphate synthase